MRNQGIRQTPDFGPGSLAFRAYQFPQFLVTLAYLRTHLFPQLLVVCAYLFPQCCVVSPQIFLPLFQHLMPLLQFSQAEMDAGDKTNKGYQDSRHGSNDSCGRAI